MSVSISNYRSRIISIYTSNYRSLDELTGFTLGDLTALVGPNGSGKSNFCDVFRFIADALKIGLEAAVDKRHGISAIRRWSSGRPNRIKFEFYLNVSHVDEEEMLIDPYSSPNCLYVLVLGSNGSKDFQVRHESAALKLPNQESGNSFIVRDGTWLEGPSDLRPRVAPLGLALSLVAGDERFRPIADALRNVSIYSIFPDTLRELQKPDHSRPMSEHGGNWSSILKDMKEESGSLDLIAAIGQLTGDIDEFRVRQLAGYLVTEFRHGQTTPTGKNGKPKPRWFEAAQESDGTLRMAGILTALLQEPSPTLLGIEEPELTVHPGAIPLLYDHIKEASQRGQVILTTHSPDLLALLDADEVRVVERHDGITTVGPMDEAQRQAVNDRLFTPGDLLRMEGLKQGPRVKSNQET